MVSYTVEKKYHREQIFDLLEEVFPDFSRKARAAAFRVGNITRNGQPVQGDVMARHGDLLQIFVTEDIVGLDLTPNIMYQDENFVVVDKPAGLLSYSNVGELNAVGLVEEYMKARGEYCLDALMVPYLLYPLDKYVSGLLIMAKHEGAFLFLMEALNQRRITIDYICPVVGRAEDAEELMAYHMKGKSQHRVKILHSFKKDAKPIVTRYRMLSVGHSMSLICARPITNAMDQVRAHLASEGLPIVGDDIYGDRRLNRIYRAPYICQWIKTVVFEVGTGHEYAYMNKKAFESQTESFVKSVYDEGLMDIASETESIVKSVNDEGCVEIDI